MLLEGFALAIASAPAASLITVTASAADKYVECPRSFWSNKHQDDGSSDPDRFSEGSALHAALKGINKLLIDQREFPETDFVASRLWNASVFRDPQREALARAKLPVAVDHFRSFVQDHDLTILGAEQFMATPPKRVSDTVLVRVKGKIDVFASRPQDNALIVLDFKTSVSLPCAEDLAAKPSSTIYACLGKRLYPGAPVVEEAQISTASGITVSAKLTTDHLSAGRDVVYRLAVALHAADESGSAAFEATPGEFCAWCRFQDTCPAFAAEVETEGDFIL